MAKEAKIGARGIGSPWRLVGWGAAVALLLLPLGAMQLTKEVDWTGSDFVAMGLMLGSVGLAFEFLLRKSDDLRYRIAVALELAASFFLVWASLAVGIIGTEGNPGNLMFAVVILIVLAGSIGANFHPDGMARAAITAAAAQIAAGSIALITRMGSSDPSWPYDILGTTLFVTGLWLVAARLFARAARS
jgi:hypothetical protein